LIFILNKEEEIIGVLSNDLDDAPLFSARETLVLKNGYSSLGFETAVDTETARLIDDEVKTGIVSKDGSFKTYDLLDLTETAVGDRPSKALVCEASHVKDLNGVIIRPITFSGQAPESMLSSLLDGSGWQVGVVEYAGTGDMEFNDYPKCLQSVLDLAKEFDLEPRFRTEMDGTRVVGKYVDLLDKVGANNGVRVDYGQDLTGFTKKVNNANKVTAVIGIGKEVDGNKTTFSDVEWSTANGDPTDKPLSQDFVVDEEAYQLYNRDGRHVFAKFEDPQETSGEKLLDKSWDYLQRIKNGITSWDVKFIVLGRLTGYEHKDFNIGDTIIVNNSSTDTPQIVEARIVKYVRDLLDESNDSGVLGDYVELLSEDNKVIKTIQEQLSAKTEIVTSTTAPTDKSKYWRHQTTGEIRYWDEGLSSWEIAVDKTSSHTSANTNKVGNTAATTVEGNAADGKSAKDKIDTDVGASIIESDSGAQSKADTAESNAKNAVANGQVTLPTGSLNGTIDTLVNQLVASGAYTTAQVLPGKGLLFENTDSTSADFGAIYIGPGLLAISNSKDANGNWVWRSFGTGNGFTGDEITGGTILGITFKTSETGDRIEITGDKLVSYGSGTGNANVELDAGGLEVIGHNGQTLNLGYDGFVFSSTYGTEMYYYESPSSPENHGLYIESDSVYIALANSLVTVSEDLDVGGTILQDAWSGVTFQNGWSAFNSTSYPVGYFKDSMGIVRTRGLITGGASNTVAFNLPAGYRPAYDKYILCLVYDGTNYVTGRLLVNTAGDVKPLFSTENYVSLDGIQFQEGG
jgi:phage minor structural protein